MRPARFEPIEHTADLAFLLEAPTEAALLEVGARAVVHFITDGAEVADTARRTVRVDSIDREDRLVQFLNEVLVLAMTEGFLFSAGTPVLFEGGLTAELRGQEHGEGEIVSELKSVTYHDLEVCQDDAGFTARVVVDV